MEEKFKKMNKEKGLWDWLENKKEKGKLKIIIWIYIISLITIWIYLAVTRNIIGLAIWLIIFIYSWFSGVYISYKLKEEDMELI